MARVTVEDCIRKIPNRFDLVLTAAARSRQISLGQGQPILVDRNRDRDSVVALREIAEGAITAEEMHEQIIANHSRHIIDQESTEENAADVAGANMSEEDMIKQLEVLESEVQDSPPVMMDQELIMDPEPVDEAPVDIVPDEMKEGLDKGDIGRAAEQEFSPQNDMDGEALDEIEIDEEMVGEAITSSNDDGVDGDDLPIGQDMPDDTESL